MSKGSPKEQMVAPLPTITDWSGGHVHRVELGDIFRNSLGQEVGRVIAVDGRRFAAGENVTIRWNVSGDDDE